MSTHVSVERDADGRPLACKRAMDGLAHDALRAEAERLAALDHPGVVRFVELRETADGPVLVTEYVGPRTLATAGIVAAERAARLIADLSTTLADLHALGVVHGVVRPEHVLLAGARTVLCGFAPEPDGAPEDDVAGAGETLRHLLDPELEEEPIPDRRPWRRLPWLGYRQRALLTLADQATDDDPSRRPSARALADALRGVAGEAAAPVVAAPDAPPTGPGWWEAVVDLVAVRVGRLRRRQRPSGARRPRRAVLALAGCGAALALVGGAGLSRGGPATARASSPTVTPSTAGPCPPSAGPLAGDLDGDGCAESVRAGPGWLEVDGDRFRVGRPGDDLTVGDWDGDGRATVALLQVRSGEIWTFPQWDPERAVPAAPVASVPGATGLRRRDLGARHALVVVEADGAEREVEWP